MFNLSMALEDSAFRHGNTPALITDSETLSYKSFNSKVNQIANGLVAQGIKPGDRIALQCPNLSSFPIVYYGILKVGAIVVPLSILFKKQELIYHLKDAGAKALIAYQGTEQLPIVDHAHAAFKAVNSVTHLILIQNKALEKPSFSEAIYYHDFLENKNTHFEFYSTKATDTAVIIYTSGTTGQPKGAELSHSNLAWNADLGRHLFQFNTKDVAITVLPLFHIFGQSCLMNACVMEGIPNVIIKKFDPKIVLDQMEQHQVSIFAGVPTMFWSLNEFFSQATYKKTRLKNHWRIAISGGAALPVAVLETFESNFNVPIYEGYGMSEGSPMVAFNHPGFPRKIGSIGFPVWGVQVKIVDETDQELATEEVGELIYRGHNVMKGYYNKIEATQKALRNGWMHSGDMAYKDEDGYFYIVDRMKDLIIRGGYNVYPREIEELMMQHPKISLVAVIGIPDPRLGEEIKAFVVVHQKESLDSQTLIAWTRERIAAYKYPRHIEFVRELPMNATGKILKRALK